MVFFRKAWQLEFVWDRMKICTALHLSDGLILMTVGNSSDWWRCIGSNVEICFSVQKSALFFKEPRKERIHSLCLTLTFVLLKFDDDDDVDVDKLISNQ